MKEQLTTFLADNGFIIFISGFILAAVGMVLFYAVKPPYLLHTIAFYSVWVGLGAYVIGRIGVILQNRRARRSRMETAQGNNEKDNA